MEVFEWTEQENEANLAAHGVSFEMAERAFADPQRRILPDPQRRILPDPQRYIDRRFLCIAEVGQEIMVVEFSYQGGKIRIFSAGYWQ